MSGLNRLARFSQAVSTLSECRSLGDFETALLAAASSLIPADLHVVDWIGPDKIHNDCKRSVETPGAPGVDVLNEHLDEHPLLPIIKRDRDDYTPRVGRWSDFIAFRQFQNTALYNNFFRHFGTRHQVAFTLRITEKSVIGVSFNRNKNDFSKGDVDSLTLFAPHVGSLLHHLVTQMELQSALALQQMAQEHLAIIIVDDACTVLFATPAARRLCNDCLTEEIDGGLPAELRAWLNRDPLPEKQSLTVQGKSAQIVVSCGRRTKWSECDETRIVAQKNSQKFVRLLRLTEQVTSLKGMVPPECGLTPREVEVLTWMARGKRNSEIALILGVSERTVDKHRENLFVKLGVETRTAAVAMLLETMLQKA